MLAVVDCRLPHDAEMSLVEQGFSLLKLPPSPLLPPPVASHPDMLVFFAPDAILTTPSYAAVANRELALLSTAAKRPLICVAEDFGNSYPRDVLLNAAPMGSALLCLPSAVTASLLENPSYQICAVRQGYAKCATLPVSESALITADPSIAKVAKKVGIDALQVRPDAVALSGYDRGFLGGAASFGPYRQHRNILFCGDLDTHPDAAAMRAFCAHYGKKTVSLSHAPLYDVGTIFLI